MQQRRKECNNIWIKRKVIPIRIKSDEEETKSIKEILKQLNIEDDETKFEEEVVRLGPYTEGVSQVKLKLQIETPFHFSHVIWSMDHTRCMGTPCKGVWGCIITHAFTTALNSPLACTIIFSCSTDILLSFNALFFFFTLSIYHICGFTYLYLTSCNVQENNYPC